tara:strand:- start:376 stop:621 length:246 start_codon:yes stop_codon:yes gene_type:complete
MPIDPLLAGKISYTLGWLNLFSMFLVLISCRCTPPFLPQKVRDSKFFQKIFNWHCYYWWLFIVSVALHGFLAVTAYGNPFV